MNQLPDLVRVFAYLSLLTVGGGMAAFPELKILTVDVHHWLTFPELVHLYSLGQMAPGPNMMMIVTVGEWTAGVIGALVVVVAFFGPTSILTLATGRLWAHLGRWPWRDSIRAGLAPVSIGLLLAGCLSFSRVAISGVATAAIAAATFLILLRYKVNPAILILAAAVIGAIAF